MLLLDRVKHAYAAWRGAHRRHDDMPPHWDDLDKQTQHSILRVANIIDSDNSGRIAELETAARKVTWFDVSDNDADFVAAVNELRKLVSGP